jgi:hypothetical protein
MDPIDARISRLLDRLEDPTIGEAEMQKIQQKIAILRKQEKRE